MSSTPTPDPAPPPAGDGPTEVPAASGPECPELSAAKPPSEASSQPAEELPPLKAQEFRSYNRMAEKMDLYHNHFRQSWKTLHDACTAGRRPARMTLKQFIDEGLQFCRMLGMHHDIEEAHIFPHLATRMPEFQKPFASQLAKIKAGDATAMDEKRSRLVLHHRQIHRGMDELEKYLDQCKGGERELEMSVMLEKLDSWGGVLWEHLDEEVKTLGAENMRKYWSLEDMRRMPF